jgi:hypothetical protein
MERGWPLTLMDRLFRHSLLEYLDDPMEIGAFWDAFVYRRLIAPAAIQLYGLGPCQDPWTSLYF